LPSRGRYILLCARGRQHHQDLDQIGYGRDSSGAQTYLGALLFAIADANEGQAELVPLHTEGDGYCLVRMYNKALMIMIIIIIIMVMVIVIIVAIAVPTHNAELILG
jgi:hypothetical protein